MQQEGILQSSGMDMNPYLSRQYVMSTYDNAISLMADPIHPLNMALPEYSFNNFAPVEKPAGSDVGSITGSTDNSCKPFLDEDNCLGYKQYDSVGSHSTIAGTMNYDRIYGLSSDFNRYIGLDSLQQNTPNSTIDGESIADDDEQLLGPDGTAPPANRRDPIYTAISGLKWKAKSKKWVVRWDNPITNRRVYKYFSGLRYGFMGAHKRAKYYLEFLNASVGRVATPSTGNPFCRRTEGPPKGKTNKGLIRRMLNSKNNFQNYNFLSSEQLNCNDSLPILKGYNNEYFINNGNNYPGSSAENPWCFNEQFIQPNFYIQ